MFGFGFDFFGFLKKAIVASDAPHDYFESNVNGCGKQKYPIIYHEKYDIGLFGFERLHPFDTHKWQKTHELLKDHFKDDFSSLSPLKEADENLLLIHHTSEYIRDIHCSKALVAHVAEVYLLYLIPNFIINWKLLQPFKWHVSGTVLACRQAMLHGAAVNLGGGFHHASKDVCSGFCFFSDIWVAIQYLWKNISDDLKFFIIDLDAHQGNGHEWDKGDLPLDQRDKILILDMYNSYIFPQASFAKRHIDYNVPIKSGTSSTDYLKKLRKVIKEKRNQVKQFKPDLVIYNAGTDVLKGDPLGRLNVTEKGIIERDELIFKFCKENGFPIVLLMSGGYQRSNAKIVADSIINLIGLGLIKPIDERRVRTSVSPELEIT